MTNLDKLLHTTIGFGNVYNDAWKKVAGGYPFYNIRRADENKYLIEMALAGFDLETIEITLDRGVLHIKSVTNGKQEALDPTTFLFNGFSRRDFHRAFTLNGGVEVKNAEFVNGVLKVFLEHVIPEEKKPKKIQINVPQPRVGDTDRLYLTEESNL